MRLRRFLEIWRQMYVWEQDIFLMMMRMSLHKRRIFPAFAWQAGAVGFTMLACPEQPLLCALVFIVSGVYGFLLQIWLKR